jgi:hypothetical protein
LVYRRRQDLNRLPLDLLSDLPMRRLATQRVDECPIAVSLDCRYQPLHLPHADSQFVGGLALRDQLLPSFLKRH